MGDDWNSFMQSKPARIVLNVLCMGLCGYHGVSALLELASPSDSAAQLIENMGQTGYVVMTVLRFVVCVWVVVAFGRMTWKTIRDED